MRRTFRRKLFASAFVVSMALFVSIVYSHCQLPCGIYNDPARFDAISEHIVTIEKAMQQITELSKRDKPNMNQVVRWVQNKDEHADELSHIVTYYFMAQRVKPVDKSDTAQYAEYVNKLTLLHEMLVYSMKAKQTTDLANVDKLRSLLSKFHKAYFPEDPHQH